MSAKPRIQKTLLDLPSSLLQHIISLSLRSSDGFQSQLELARNLLYRLGPDLAHHTKQVIWSKSVLPDDDEILIYAENELHRAKERGSRSGGSRSPSEATEELVLDEGGNDAIKSLIDVYRDRGTTDDVAQMIQSLEIVRYKRASTHEDFNDAPFFPFQIDDSPSRPSPHFASSSRSQARRTQEVDSESAEHASMTDPIDDIALLYLLSRLTSLTKFEWKATRHPPSKLCAALGISAKNLTSFVFDLVEPAVATHPKISFGASSPNATTPSRSLSNPIIVSTSSHHQRIPRWDADELSALPISLSHLALSHLSQKGVEELATALPSLPALAHLELGHSVFIDDSLLNEISQNAKRLTRLRLFELPGTRLTETGLAYVLDGCSYMSILELECIQGRFSKATWSKLSPLPSQLHTLSLTYSEHPISPHKSWLIDHLASLPGALATSSIVNLTVSRKIADDARIPGQHWFSLHPVDTVVTALPLPTNFIETIVNRGAGWKKLNLDFWHVNLEMMKLLLQACSELIDLQFMLDAPFKHILQLSSSFAFVHNLRHIVVSIDPSHHKELASVATALLTPSQSPSSTFAPLPTPPMSIDPPASPPQSLSPQHGRRSSMSSTTSLDQHLSSIAPVTRDWRRFLKKTLSLESITWGGRGGIGTWYFERSGSLSSTIKIEFEPANFTAQPEDALALLAPVPPSARGMKRQHEVTLEGTCLEDLEVDFSLAPKDTAVEQDLFTFSPPKSSTVNSSGGLSFSADTTFERSSTPPIGTWTSRSHVEQQLQDSASLDSTSTSARHQHHSSTSSAASGRFESQSSRPQSNQFAPSPASSILEKASNSSSPLAVRPSVSSSKSSSPIPSSPPSRSSTSWARVAAVPTIPPLSKNSSRNASGADSKRRASSDLGKGAVVREGEKSSRSWSKVAGGTTRDFTKDTPGKSVKGVSRGATGSESK